MLPAQATATSQTQAPTWTHLQVPQQQQPPLHQATEPAAAEPIDLHQCSAALQAEAAALQQQALALPLVFQQVQALPKIHELEVMNRIEVSERQQPRECSPAMDFVAEYSFEVEAILVKAQQLSME